MKTKLEAWNHARVIAPAVFAIVLVIHFILGAIYSGPTFFKSFSTAVPTLSSGGGSQPEVMIPGDHFQQYYRYNLPLTNLTRGHPLYYNGYQYNLGDGAPSFSEGPIFFPFNLIFVPLGWVTGPIAAYNLLALLSFPLVGGAMFLLLRRVTGNTPASILGSLILALLPHRTSFLFGEMVYGMDLVWAPLSLLFFEQLVSSQKARHVAMLGLSLFFHASSNIQSFYFFCLFTSPYFLWRGIPLAGAILRTPRRFVRLLAVAGLTFAPLAAYVLHLRAIISSSGIAAGQAYDEARFYSPTFANMFETWSGNEKSVYLGWPLLILIGMLMFKRYFPGDPAVAPETRGASSMIGASLVCFACSYAFCFGPNLDAFTHLGLFDAYFHHVPGASGTRTPGRLMSTAGFHFAFLFGLLAARSCRPPRRKTTLGLLLRVGAFCAVAMVIVGGYYYTRPVMVLINEDNRAYEALRDHRGIVLPIPFASSLDHRNSTFLFYAQNYNLRLFAGYSSLYPKRWREIATQLAPVNGGRFDRAIKDICLSRGIDRVVVHHTAMEPNVSSVVLARLRQSPFLTMLASDGGITAFAVKADAAGDQVLDPNTLYPSVGDHPPASVDLLDGWHSLETYPNQRPFRWTTGLSARAIFRYSGKPPMRLKFDYKAPFPPIRLKLNGKLQPFVDEPQTDGWSHVTVQLDHLGDVGYIEIEILASAVFHSPPDTRDFGCMISRMTVE